MNQIGKGSDLALARRIRSTGIPIFIEEDDGAVPQIPSRGLRIYQAGSLVGSRAFDFHGAAAYILEVVITFNLPQFAISYFTLELPYKGMVTWLPDPLEYFDMKLKDYVFRGQYPLIIPRGRVLNHLADVRRVYSRGDSLKGELLGIGEEPIPENFKHGEMIPAFLTVSDQYGREYRSAVSMWADRMERPNKRKRAETWRRGGLLDKLDPGFEPAPCEEEKGKKEG